MGAALVATTDPHCWAQTVSQAIGFINPQAGFAHYMMDLMHIKYWEMVQAGPSFALPLHHHHRLHSSPADDAQESNIYPSIHSITHCIILLSFAAARLFLRTHRSEVPVSPSASREFQCTEQASKNSTKMPTHTGKESGCIMGLVKAMNRWWLCTERKRGGSM